ncbi:type II toxin-antitoxin system antitoxin DNA ADP-ribosyl glycohydrolase DarG [Jeotgalibacillus terrae]|uniref:Macro domain-containing protein n=1 Tax=Jeotgalibacillus terrae TaxID=587735 RepID=A0ABW5ZJC4_9BACL|nr:O-acetyl-ADP-ribose deacetylase (regulator of RNase III) [Jeotgalibacillus terrae]
MIIFKSGNLLEDSAEAYVNTVNTVGVMGKGIALQFKQAFPQVYKEYEKDCRKGLVQTGHMHVVKLDGLTNPKYVINFPTKQHWKSPSKIEYIQSGLIDLIRVIQELNIRSIALPPLGCGNGGLDWKKVLPEIEAAFNNTNVEVHLYAPEGAPEPDQLTIRTKKPKMTKGRALLISLMDSYAAPGYRLSNLEVQKLAYFLQEAGEQMKLDFKKYKYGPYAENLNHVLQRIEGHYIRGYGDRTREAEIYLIDDATEKAKEFLQSDNVATERLKEVKSLIKGFENPYGMELLSTVYWIMKENPMKSKDYIYVAEEVKNWNPRKREIFSDNHILKVWTYLDNQIDLKEKNPDEHIL